MKNIIYLSLAFTACMALFTAPLFAEAASIPKHPDNKPTPAASGAQNQDVKNKEAASEYRKWVEAEQDQSGHIGYSFFEKHNKK